jgi:uncharacterized SAM-binding protein YcdF (DUF218 family)
LLRFARNDTKADADAIVVLGCRVDDAGLPSERMRRRMALAVALYRDGAAPLIVLSGGGLGPVAEAAAMRDLALAAGIPAAVLLLEPDSRDTLANAINTARLLQAVGKRRIVLVTDRLHLPRASLLFRRAGLDIAAVAGVSARSIRTALAAACYEIASLIRAVRRR